MSLPAVMDPRLLPAVVMTDPRHHVTGNAYTHVTGNAYTHVTGNAWFRV